MSTEYQTVLMLELARDVVAETAPQELPMFSATSSAYLQNPRRRNKKSKDEVLGFGAGETIAFITPVVLSIANDVIAYLVEEAKKTLKTESGEAVTRYIKRLFKQPESDDRPAGANKPTREQSPALTPEQIAQVHKIAYKQALSFDMPPGQAKLFAEAMAGRLVLAKPARAR